MMMPLRQLPATSRLVLWQVRVVELYEVVELVPRNLIQMLEAEPCSVSCDAQGLCSNSEHWVMTWVNC